MDHLTSYIRLSISATDTAWSMRWVSIYINDDTSCSFSLNLNLLNSPLTFGLLRVFVLLPSVRSSYKPLGTSKATDRCLELL